uniref:Uncharacterized protein n=1 Tax=Rhizophora mucronata TaxID=61149 RepID=A0A2P2KND0_RHIMU
MARQIKRVLWVLLQTCIIDIQSTRGRNLECQNHLIGLSENWSEEEEEEEKDRGIHMLQSKLKLGFW